MGALLVPRTRSRIRLLSKTHFPFCLLQVYYFPKNTVDQHCLQNVRQSEDGNATYDLVVGDKKASRSVTVFETGDFVDFIRIDFDAADAWFEEDQRMYVHPRDPYKVCRSLLPIFLGYAPRLLSLTHCCSARRSCRAPNIFESKSMALRSLTPRIRRGCTKLAFQCEHTSL